MDSKFVMLLLALASFQVAESCIANDHYLKLEQSLLKRKENIDSLTQAFFPTNRQASISVNVTYHFVDSDNILQYRWIDSSINMLIRGDLLTYLSLSVYNVDIRHANITLDLPCDIDFDNSDPQTYCYGSSTNKAYLFLNELTTNVSMDCVYTFCHTNYLQPRQTSIGIFCCATTRLCI